MPGVVVVDKPAYQPPPLKTESGKAEPKKAPAEGCGAVEEVTEEVTEEVEIEEPEGCAEGCAPDGCGEGCGE